MVSEVQRAVEMQVLKSQGDTDDQHPAVSNAKGLLHHRINIESSSRLKRGERISLYKGFTA